MLNDRAGQGVFEIWAADNADERAAWLELWKSWPDREVFAHPGYGELFAGEHDRFLCASYVVPGAGAVIYPFIHRQTSARDDLGNPLTDLVSPYGYGGPYFWDLPAKEETTDAFWSEFDSWAASNNVVTELVRFDLHAGTLLAYPGETVARSRNVSVPLGPDDDAIWMGFEQKVRKNVKKAQRSGVTVEVDLDGAFLSDFLRLYEGTMDRRDAGAGYYFGRSFFERLTAVLEGQFAYFHAIVDGQIVSTELVLVSERSVYSFLGGTDSSAFALRPNDLLKYEVIRWAKARGKSEFVLGGGATPGDGIERYKRSFAPDGLVEFFTGQRVLQHQPYETMVEAQRQTFASAGHDWPTESTFFPQYRMTP